MSHILKSYSFFGLQIREVMGVHPCDRRRSIKELKQTFPFLDFSDYGITHEQESLPDPYWKKDERETDESMMKR